MDKNKGLTLVEILVSAIIMALIMAGLANIFAAGKRHIIHSRSRITAGELGRYFLDLLQMDVRQDQWGSNCLSTNATGCPENVTIDNINYTFNDRKITDLWSGSPCSVTNPCKVRLNITWNETQF